MPSYEAILSAAASLTASAILLRTVANDFFPDALKDHFFFRLQKISSSLSSHLTVIIEESDGLTANQIFHAANVYLGKKLSSSTSRLKVNKPEKEKGLQLTADKNQELVDVFKGVKLKWVLLSSSRSHRLVSNKKNNTGGMLKEEIWYFELSFHKKNKEMVLSSYLPYVLQKAKEIKEEKKTLKLHTVDYNGTDYWGSINLDHPASFDTMAMDLEMKKALMEDLEMFIRRKEFYRRVGKAWKRGYLLYGPPGTGKSSLVAAMANYLKFDVYDLDLREVQCNSDLRRLLIGTGNRSIIVIEDIDNSLDSSQVTLSGLLNFIDGLWSSCGDERIIVFTTNHKDRLDPVLLRPGRMDMHLHMSYCTFSGLRTLAANYLQIQDHPLFEEIKRLLEKVQATPAEVAGELMKKEDPDVALRGLIECLHNRTTAQRRMIQC